MSVRPSGYYVLTPLVRTDGSVAIVNRGWVPREAAVDGEWSRPVGHVEVIGVLSGGEKVSQPDYTTDGSS
jgi:cytochrome oxidase assembly protein ShyY1